MRERRARFFRLGGLSDDSPKAIWRDKNSEWGAEREREREEVGKRGVIRVRTYRHNSLVLIYRESKVNERSEIALRNERLVWN